MPKFLTLTAATLSLALAGSTATGFAAETTYYKMATISPGNTIYSVTAAYAQAATKYVPGVEMQLSASGSAAQHMLRMARGNLDFAMTSTILAHFMSKGAAMYAKIDNAPALFGNLRSVFNFSGGAFHFVTYADSGITSLKDIKGRTVFLGPPSGGATAFATGLVEGYTGLKAGKDFKVARMGFNASTQAFMDRKIDVWMLPTLVPGASVQQVALSNKIRLLGIPEDDFTSNPAIAKMMSLPGRSVECVPPHAYGDNQVNERPQCFGVAWVGVGASKDTPADAVYAITKAFWTHIDDLHSQGEMMKNINLQNALKQVNMPLHPGALRYYREAGLNIPDALVPPEAK